ncbi:MAG: hypothetical protein CVV56_06190 [Tenericutes bacterium HGW-Tenericutes-1]|jgi:hypothetical protein|nr:MAG: hypothetical protein CVV58_06355 [Tenericutes bacterium HGW-Tenericutes-3]PKL00453.1 MAG: hypothetical protein CVV56_06190 [Tenericutes bacterium HGW-Tenericutes-1]
MRKLLNHKGFSMIEAIASVFIITLVITSAITIIINIRNQTLAANEKIVATQVGTLIRDDLIQTLDYATVSTWMNGTSKTVTSTTCGVGTPVSCSFFQYTSNNLIYDEELIITFLTPTADDNNYQVIHFAITIVYYQTRELELVGMIYE